VLRLGHLNLTVASQEASLAYYRRWFGFDRILAEYEDDTTFITDESGFELALHTGQPSAGPGWHFGFLASSADLVRQLAREMEEAGEELVDREDTLAYVGFKCHDPDGHEIEVYYEPRR
jgi:catechol 2,3-dioxygenase-like lactoylglutathione lyase family enzyme